MTNTLTTITFDSPSITPLQSPNQEPHFSASRVESELARRAIDASAQSNDDIVHTKTRDVTYLSTDAGGAIRQGAVIFTSMAELLDKAVSPFIPLAMLITYLLIGTANTYAATFWTKPDAKKALETAIEVYSILERFSALTPEEAKKHVVAIEKRLFALESSEASSKEKEDAKKALGKAKNLEKAIEVYSHLRTQLSPDALSKKMDAAKEDARKAIETAQLNVENHKWYNRMGQGQKLLSIESGVSWGLAHKGVSFAGLKIIEAVSSIAFGILLLFRGKALMKRGFTNYQIAHGFHNEFRRADNPIAFMQEAEEIDQASPGYLMRRVNAACLEHIEAGNTWKCMANGMQLIKEGNREISNGRVVKLTRNKNYQVEYLKRVDKGMYTEELKHYVTLIIAWSMLIAGITTIIAASILTGGIPLYITIASAAFFLLMEVFFLTYDSGFLFTKLRNMCYEDDWLKQALEENIFQQKVDLNTWIDGASVQSHEAGKWLETWKRDVHRDAQNADRLTVVSEHAVQFFDYCDEMWEAFYASLLQNGREMAQVYRT